MTVQRLITSKGPRWLAFAVTNSHYFQMKERLTFTCEVPKEGFKWRSGPFLVLLSEKKYSDREFALVGVDADAPVLHFPPHPEIYLTFGALDPASDAAILDFANDYGLLSGTAFRLGFSSTAPAVIGEPRSYWRTHINKMDEALWLWRTIKADSNNLLADRFRHVAGSEQVHYGGGTIESPEFRRDRLDLRLPARMHLQDLINAKLKEFVEYRLLFTADRKTTGMFCVPNSLIGCLWAQLALAVADFDLLRNCLVCNKLIRTAGAGPRSNKTTCSHSCRTKLYRVRKTKGAAARARSRQ